MTTQERADAQKQLDLCAQFQHTYWDSLSDLERLLGFDVDGNQDLEGMTVKDLLEQDGQNGEEDEPDDPDPLIEQDQEDDKPSQEPAPTPTA